MLGRDEWVLAGENQAQFDAAPVQSGGNWAKLDCFRTGSDDDVDTRTGQPSP
jgi:hypothetical protein